MVKSKIPLIHSVTRQRRAFTLVEILVVVTIILVLASILLAVFSRVRENGRRTVCSSNLKQMALAIQMYTQANDNRYPHWLLWQQDISSYVKSKEVFVCPTRPTGGIYHNIESYKYNFQRLTAFPTVKTNIGRSDTQVINPANTWLTSDRDDYGELEEISMCGRDMNWVTIHSGGACYSFVDGHVKWLLPNAISKIECSLGPLPKARDVNAPASSDN